MPRRLDRSQGCLALIGPNRDYYRAQTLALVVAVMGEPHEPGFLLNPLPTCRPGLSRLVPRRQNLKFWDITAILF